MRVCIVIPAYEPGGEFVPYAQEVLAAGLGPVLVVDDGSGPAYAPVFAALAEMGCTVLTHEQNRGKGAALKTALRWYGAHEDGCAGIVTADCDGQHTVKDVRRVCEAMEACPGTLVLGAPEFIRPDLVFDEEIESARADGARVLRAALAGEFAGFQDRLSEAEPIAAIIISDPLREDAAECIRFFQENEVDIKIISGDNPKTVSALARQAGVRGAQHCVDASLLQSDEEIEEAILNHSVIGRASPQQKHKMILTLQQRGHKVAMTGDGVNDVLALKDADVSIAMGNGSDAAKQISQFVVINGELSTLAEVVKEGRLDTNNVTRSASMYYLKTIYTILISLIILVLNIPYPFIPFQMTLLDNFVAGFPSFMILFERNIERQKESIGRHALRYSLPNALAIVMAVIAVHLIGTQAGLNQHEVFTILYFSTSLLSIHMIYRIYSPLNWYRALVLVLDVIGFILASLLFYDWLQLAEMNVTLAGYIVIIVIAGFILASIIAHLVNRYLDRNPQVKPKKVIMRQTMPAEK